MDIQTIIVGVIVLVCAALAVRHFYKTLTRKEGCNCGCAGCKYNKNEKKNEENKSCCGE